jgi:hypothetical protein
MALRPTENKVPPGQHQPVIWLSIGGGLAFHLNVARCRKPALSRHVNGTSSA